MAGINEKIQQLEKDKKSEERKGPPNLQSRQKQLEQLMTAIVIVLFIGFAGVFVAVSSMLVDSWTNKQATYQQLEDKVDSQNIKIDSLQRMLNEQKTIQKAN